MMVQQISLSSDGYRLVYTECGWIEMNPQNQLNPNATEFVPGAAPLPSGDTPYTPQKVDIDLGQDIPRMYFPNLTHLEDMWRVAPYVNGQYDISEPFAYTLVTLG
eukprot:Trichotokara_eunicae@DN8029_c0_g1_i1.p1